MFTVLPTPAPPNRPTLPPLANGQIRSMTLMPVSSRSLEGTAVVELPGLAVDRAASLLDRAALVDRVAQHVHDAAERRLPTGTDRRAGVGDHQAAAQAVGRTRRWCARRRRRAAAAPPASGPPAELLSSSFSASYMDWASGRGNSTSTTAPMHWTILPRAWFGSALVFPSIGF